MDREAVLQESRTMRGGMADRVEALDRVKALVLLPDGVHVTARMVADYYGVGDRAVESVVRRHRAELTEHGYRLLKAADLQSFVSANLAETTTLRSGLGIFPRRAVLVVGMLLRGSAVARAVRRELLDLAERAVSGAAEWRYELAELREELAEIRELQLVMLRQSQLDREVIAGLSVRMADCQSAVRTLGGRVDMLCTVLAARGPAERRRRRRR